MGTIARSTVWISSSIALSIVALGCAAHSPTAPPPTANSTPTQTLTSAPGGTTYHLSGIVTDDNGSPVANAPLALYYNNTFSSAKTSTDGGGHYNIVFETTSRIFDGNSDVVGAILYTGGGEYENNYVQAVPAGTAEIVRDLHLRRVRTIEPGQSLTVSIDSDSSVSYDGDDAMMMNGLWEKFHVRTVDAGTLKVTVSPLSGGYPQIAVYCVYASDNCLGDNYVGPVKPGTASHRVNANSVHTVRLYIPSQMAPQRYAVSTSLEP